MGFPVKLHRSNPKPLTSALGQKRTSEPARVLPSTQQLRQLGDIRRDPPPIGTVSSLFVDETSFGVVAGSFTQNPAHRSFPPHPQPAPPVAQLAQHVGPPPAQSSARPPLPCLGLPVLLASCKPGRRAPASPRSVAPRRGAGWTPGGEQKFSKPRKRCGCRLEPITQRRV